VARRLLRQPRLGASWRDDQLGREDHLRLADAVLGHVSAHKLDHGPVAALSSVSEQRQRRRIAFRSYRTQNTENVSLPSPSRLPGAVAPLNPMLARSGGAARFVVVEKTDPLDATAITSGEAADRQPAVR
jgi:hypothetical protein